MLAYLAAILGLGLLCGGWVVFQRWISRHDAGAPGVEGRCGTCDVPKCPADEDGG